MDTKLHNRPCADTLYLAGERPALYESVYGSKKVIAIVAEKGNVISSIVAKLKELGMDFKANSVGKEDGETDWE